MCEQDFFLNLPVVRDLIFSPCGGIGGPLGPLVYEYYDEDFDNRKNPEDWVGGPKGPPTQSSAHNDTAAVFFVLHILYFPEFETKLKIYLEEVVRPS